MATNHGQFYKADQLVAAVHRDNGGIFAGFRAAHAFGHIYAGTFTALPVAKTLSRAAHFQGTPVPVTARLSGASGDPNKKPSNIVAMATKFYLPDGTVTDLIGITLPAFFARTPEEFLAFTEAHTADPATGEPDLAKLKAFAAAHPNGGRFLLLVQKQPAVVSFAQVSYRPLHTYRFVNAAGVGRWARYHWEPEAGTASQLVEELEKQPHDYLYEEFERRLQVGPVVFRLELELAQEGDPVDDPSAIWPNGRERVVVGRLELVRAITEAEIGDPVMMHDPSQVTDGIEVSPDDQILAARRGSYLISVAERTGGWQRRSPVLAKGCPFHTQTNSKVSVHECHAEWRCSSAEPLAGEPVRLRADVVSTGGSDTSGRDRSSRVWPVRAKRRVDVATRDGGIHPSRCRRLRFRASAHRWTGRWDSGRAVCRSRATQPLPQPRRG
jgi:catalase